MSVPWSKVMYLDAGYGSLQLAGLLAKRYIHCVMAVKHIDKYFPKQALYDLLENAEAGAKACLELEVGDFERDIIAVGYKYNQRKTLYFIMTRGAGSLQGGQPYLAKFASEWGNTVTRGVRRPREARAGSREQRRETIEKNLETRDEREEPRDERRERRDERNEGRP